MREHRPLLPLVATAAVLIFLTALAVLRRPTADPRAREANQALRSRNNHDGQEAIHQSNRTPFVVATREDQSAAMDRAVVNDMLLSLERAAAAGDHRLIAAIHQGLARHAAVSRELVAEKLRNSHDATSRATLEEAAAKLR